MLIGSLVQTPSVADLGRGDSAGDLSPVGTHDGAVGLDDSHGSAQSVVLCQSSCIYYTEILILGMMVG